MPPDSETDTGRRPMQVYLDHDRLMDCVHCGLCLAQCPTYAENGLEADSPRGRIYLMRALAEGRTEPAPDVVEHLDLCLGCRACETACPSGVQYGHLLEGTRAYLWDNYQPPRGQRMLQRVVEAVFPHPGRLQVALLPVRLLRRTGVMGLLRKSGLMGRLGDMEELLPELPASKPFRRDWKAHEPEQARVGMITGCVMQVLQPEVNKATAQVLTRAGCSIAAPASQGCCGALHAHSGAMEEARRLARHNIGVFEQAGNLEAIIINAAGCGSALKEYGGWLRDDPQWAARAEAFSSKVNDVSEFLAAPAFKERLVARMRPPTKPIVAPMADVPREVVPNTAGATTVQAQPGQDAPPAEDMLAAQDGAEATAPPAGPGQRPAPGRATYHDACHLAHGQGVRAEPRSLLEAVPGLEMVPLRESEMCCGSAGTYNLTQPEMSMRLLQRKMQHIAATGAATVVTGNPGCAMQIALGARKFGVKVQVRHPVQVLEEATRPR